MKKQTTYITLISFLLLNNAAVIAQTPDNSFGANGQVYTSFGNFYSDCHAMLLLPNGKIVSAGENGNTTFAILISQHNTDGTLDTTFNASGKKQIDFGSAYEYCNTIKVQPDNKLVVAGSSNGSAAIARLLPDGEIDTTFSNDGKATVSFGAGNGSSFKEVLIQPDGKMVLIGEAYSGTNFDFCAVRVEANGALDTTFGNAGKTLIDFNNFNDFGRGAFLQADGKIIIVGGAKKSNGNTALALVRLNTDGAIDSTFGTSGKTTVTINNTADNYAEAIAIDNNGKIIIGGYVAGDFLVMRFNANGIVDASFGNAGKTVTDFDNFQDKAYALAIDTAGSIYMAGHGWETGNGGLLHFAIAKYLSAGNLDNSFNNDGKMTMVMGAYGSTIFDIAIQPDGKLLFGGVSTAIAGGYSEFALLRLTNTNTSAIDAIAIDNNIFIYPNPANSVIHFGSTDLQKALFIKVYGVDGQLIIASKINADENSIDVSKLPSGIYHALLINDKETKSINFIKQ